MQYYISLQFRLLKRHIEDLGIPFRLFPVLLAVVWALLFRLIEQHPSWSPYVLVFFNIYACVPLSNPDRNDFLKLLYKSSTYKQIRVSENLLIVLPFVLLFIAKGLYSFALGSLLASILLSSITFRTTTSRAMPAPFSKYPYEGQQFFRRFWWLLTLVYLIAFMGLISANFNLGIFTAAVVLFFFTSIIDHKEPEYYIWVYSKNPKAFLWQKILRLSVQLTILLAPIYIGLLILFSNLYYITLLAGLSTILVLATSVVVMYQRYPHQVSIPVAFILGLCFIFPPLCFLVFPIMYGKAIHNLKRLL